MIVLRIYNRRGIRSPSKLRTKDAKRCPHLYCITTKITHKPPIFSRSLLLVKLHLQKILQRKPQQSHSQIYFNSDQSHLMERNQWLALISPPILTRQVTWFTSFQTSNKIRSQSNTKRLLSRTNQIDTKKRATNLKVANLWKDSTSMFTVLHPDNTLFEPRMGFCQIPIFNSLKASLPLRTIIKVKKQEAQ